MTTNEYLYDTEDTNRNRELTFGRCREPPAPFFSHQTAALRVPSSLADHAEPRVLGRVAMAPVDVILDRERALIVQPDVLFISQDALGIIRDQVWGPPDLVVEVLSPATEHRDRREKLGVVPAIRRPGMLAGGPARGTGHGRRLYRSATHRTRRQQACDSIRVGGPARARRHRCRRFCLVAYHIDNLPARDPV